MDTQTFFKKLFSDIDKSDASLFAEYLSDNVHFRFGNMPAIDGKNRVKETIAGFYNSIKSLSHDVNNIYDLNGVVVCNGTVTYTKHDATLLTVPFANIFKLDGEKISEYLIYADTSQLYN